MNLRFAFFLALLAALPLSGCTQFPELDGTLADTDKDAPYPSLLPKSQFSQAATQVSITPQITQGLEGRVDRLRARANGLRSPALTPRERARLENAIRR